ncbi:hypothetical protein ACH4JS_01105 [Streptomyces sp. NPDC017638]|uniref:hypothetical protein n=1 Tax=Streptomyces sp. NPDC017638 TaxID=3365004 RepID=UPI0037BDD435
MTNLEVTSSAPAEPGGGLAALWGDCARMAPHWAAPQRAASCPVSPSRIHGVSVPARSARLLDAMSDYGD